MGKMKISIFYTIKRTGGLFFFFGPSIWILNFAEHSHETSSDSELVKHLKGIIKVVQLVLFVFFCYFSYAARMFVEMSLKWVFVFTFITWKLYYHTHKSEMKNDLSSL